MFGHHFLVQISSFWLDNCCRNSVKPALTALRLAALVLLSKMVFAEGSMLSTLTLATIWAFFVSLGVAIYLIIKGKYIQMQKLMLMVTIIVTRLCLPCVPSPSCFEHNEHYIDMSRAHFDVEVSSMTRFQKPASNSPFCHRKHPPIPQLD